MAKKKVAKKKVAKKKVVKKKVAKKKAAKKTKKKQRNLKTSAEIISAVVKHAKKEGSITAVEPSFFIFR